MSDPKADAALLELQAKMAEEQKFENLKHETSKKRAVIDSKRIDTQLKKLQQDEKDMELAKNANYDVLSDEQVKNINEKTTNTSELQGVRSCL